MVTGPSDSAQVIASWVVWLGDLDTPVPAHSLGETTRRDVLAENVVADLVAVLSLALRLADSDPDRLQVGPTRTVRQILRDGTDKVTLLTDLHRILMQLAV